METSDGFEEEPYAERFTGPPPPRRGAISTGRPLRGPWVSGVDLTVMGIVVLAGRLALAAVFLVAGAAKLADLHRAQEGVLAMGVPRPLAPALGVLLPLAELATALALLPAVSARWGATAALGLLLVFVVGIGANLATGRRPPCQCFGQLHAQAIGRRTLVRDAALAALAGAVAWWAGNDPGPSVVAWMGRLSVGETVDLVGIAVLLVVAVAQSHVILNLVAQQGRLLVRLEALEGSQPGGGRGGEGDHGPLPAGAVAPEFSLPSPDGDTVSLADLRDAGRPVLLVFGDPGCSACEDLLGGIGLWPRDVRERLTVALVSRGGPEAATAGSRRAGLSTILLQSGDEVTRAYRLRGTPSAVAVGVHGRTLAAVAEGADAVRSLAADLTAVHGATGDTGALDDTGARSRSGPPGVVLASSAGGRGAV